MKRFSVAAAAVLLAGCLGQGDVQNVVTLNFDFDIVGEDWISGVADITPAQVPGVGLIAELKALPAPLPTTRDGLRLSGTTANGKLFMYSQKRFTGLAANTTYEVEVAVEFASDIHAGCTTGIGPVSYIKAGASVVEPVTTVDGQGVLRMNINKGTGSAAGDFIMQSDIRNENTGCPAPGTFGLRGGIYKPQAQMLTTDGFGGLWLWVGVETGANGPVDIYFSGMSLRIRH